VHLVGFLFIVVTTQKLGRVRAVPRFCRFYPGICLTTEEKARNTAEEKGKSMSIVIVITFTVV
jgi:hypothetical protein